jgi:predicted HicB family RNase H-like nuclease
MYDMSDGFQRTAKTIRIYEDAYHQARVAAVTSKKSLGQWLEEAISEKVAKEETAVKYGN